MNTERTAIMRKEKLSLLLLILVMLISAFPVLTYADVQSALTSADPVIKIISYEIIDGSVELDNEFTIKITLKNCNTFATAYNVIADVSSEDMDLRLIDGEVNQVYFQSIAPNATVSFTQKFSLEETYPYRSAMLTYTFYYSGENGIEFDNRTIITPKVTIPCKLKLNVLSVASTASVGSRSLVNVRCTNSGAIDMSSLVMKIEGNIVESQKTTDLGALKSGEQVMQDCYVNFIEEGLETLKISFEYKDESGNTYTLPESEYTVEVTSFNKTSVDSTSKSNSRTISIAGRTFSAKWVVATIIFVCAVVYLIVKLLKSTGKGRSKK